MEKKFVFYRGTRMIEGWPEKIQAAQEDKTVSIGSIPYERIRYGFEADDWGADKQACHDCAVIKGEFHVFGCDVERCPACGGQMITCDCVFDED